MTPTQSEPARPTSPAMSGNNGRKIEAIARQLAAGIGCMFLTAKEFQRRLRFLKEGERVMRANACYNNVRNTIYECIGRGSQTKCDLLVATRRNGQLLFVLIEVKSQSDQGSMQDKLHFTVDSLKNTNFEKTQTLVSDTVICVPMLLYWSAPLPKGFSEAMLGYLKYDHGFPIVELSGFQQALHDVLGS